MKSIFINHESKKEQDYYPNEYSNADEITYKSTENNSKQDKKELDDAFMNSIHHSKNMGASILFSQEEESELENSQTIEEYCKQNSIREDEKQINGNLNIIQENDNSDFPEEHCKDSDSEIVNEYCDESEQLSFDEFLMNNKREIKDDEVSIKQIESQKEKVPKSQTPKINIVHSVYKDKKKASKDIDNSHRQCANEKQCIVVFNSNNKSPEKTAVIINNTNKSLNGQEVHVVTNNLKPKTGTTDKKIKSESFQIKVPIVPEINQSKKVEITSIKEAEEYSRTKKIKKQI